jgi:hypothetical protein
MAIAANKELLLYDTSGNLNSDGGPMGAGFGDSYGGDGTGFGGGLAITAGVAGALIALAKLLGGEDSMEEGKEVEEPSLYEEEVNENVGSTLDKMLQTFEFSEKGNDEMIEFGNYILSPEGPKNIAMSIKTKLKGEGGENYFTSKPEELDAFLSKLK